MTTRHTASAARSSLRPLVVGALAIGFAALASYVFDYLTVDQYLVATTDAHVEMDEVAITAQRSGVVRDVFVADHQQVAAGQVLARLGSPDGTAGDLDIVAPAAGIVVINDLYSGRPVAAGGPVMALVKPGSAYVVARLKESQMTYVGQGQSVVIESPALANMRLYGHVAGVAEAQQAEGGPRTTREAPAVKIVFDDSRAAASLRPGMRVRSTIQTGLILVELPAEARLDETNANGCRATSLPLAAKLNAADVLLRI